MKTFQNNRGLAGGRDSVMIAFGREARRPGMCLSRCLVLRSSPAEAQDRKDQQVRCGCLDLRCAGLRIFPPVGRKVRSGSGLGERREVCAKESLQEPLADRLGKS